MPGCSPDDAEQILHRAVTVLAGLAKSCQMEVEHEGREPIERYPALPAVLDRDATDSLAALELVLVQLTISSQLIDNLNASIHLRALLTDLFCLARF